MSRIVTLRLPDATYQRFKFLAQSENRALSNFIENAAFRYTESDQYVDEFEMEEIRTNAALNQSLKQGVKDAKAGRGRFA
jgi:predicted transcriptional regulator